MNTLITGQIGSGKTYFALQHFIIPALRDGRFVYTNVDFGHSYIYDVWSLFSRHLNKDVSTLINVVVHTKEFLEYLKLISYSGEGSRLPHRSVVVIDEAHQIFNYLDTNRVPRQVWEFLAYSRHFGIELVFISQSPELLSKFVINLCNNFIHLHTLKNTTRLFSNYFRYDVRNSLYGQVLQTRIKKYDKNIFRLYRSFVADDESIISRPFLIKGYAKPLFALLLVSFLLFYSVKNIHKNYFFRSSTSVQVNK